MLGLVVVRWYPEPEVTFVTELVPERAPVKHAVAASELGGGEGQNNNALGPARSEHEMKNPFEN